MTQKNRINNICMTRNDVMRRSGRTSTSVALHVQFHVPEYSKRDVSVRLPKRHKWDFTKSQLMDYYVDKVHTATGAAEFVDTEAFPLEDWDRVWDVYDSVRWVSQ